MLPGCRVARFPGGGAAPLTPAAYVPVATSPASFFPVSSVAENTFLKRNLMFLMPQYLAIPFISGILTRLFSLVASAAPRVPRHLFPGESLKILSPTCVLNSTHI